MRLLFNRSSNDDSKYLIEAGAFSLRKYNSYFVSLMKDIKEWFKFNWLLANNKFRRYLCNFDNDWFSKSKSCSHRVFEIFFYFSPWIYLRDSLIVICHYSIPQSVALFIPLWKSHNPCTVFYMHLCFLDIWHLPIMSFGVSVC